LLYTDFLFPLDSSIALGMTDKYAFVCTINIKNIEIFRSFRFDEIINNIFLPSNRKYA